MLHVLQIALSASPCCSIEHSQPRESDQKCKLHHWVLFYLESSNGPQLPQSKSQTPRSLVPLSLLGFYLLFPSSFTPSSHPHYLAVPWTWGACSCLRDVALAVHLPETDHLPDIFTTCSFVSFKYLFKCHLLMEPFPDHPVVNSFLLYFHSWCPFPDLFLSIHSTSPFYILYNLLVFCCLPPSTRMQATCGQRRWLLISWLYPQSLEKYLDIVGA